MDAAKADSPETVRGCPTCGAAFTGYSLETTQPDTVEYDGSLLLPVLKGVQVTDTSAAFATALTLTPCGCRIPVDEWQLCMTATDRWFARPADVETTIRQAMA